MCLCVNLFRFIYGPLSHNLLAGVGVLSFLPLLSGREERKESAWELQIRAVDGPARNAPSTVRWAFLTVSSDASADRAFEERAGRIQESRAGCGRRVFS